MKDEIHKKIIQIEKEISERQKDISDISLFQGMGGLPIFYFLLYKLTNKEEYRDKIHVVIENITNLLNTGDYSLTYCDGLTGIGYMLNFIKNKEILTNEVNFEIEESLEFIDQCIVEFALKNTKGIEELDFLHGAFGAAFYLNERLKNNKNPELKNKVTVFFELLSTIVIKEVEKTNKVKNVIDIDNSTQRTNCGLAHGHISYILIFSDFLAQFKDNNLVFEALKKSVSCLLEFENNDKNNLSAYPSIAVNKNTGDYNVSLGWCYGDQTISLGLYKASLILNDNNIKNIAFRLAFRNMERNTIEKMFATPFYDAGFCHGLSGIAYLHKKWSIISTDKKFYELYENLINDILELSCKNDGIAGFKKFNGNGYFVDSIGMLDGVIGIGMVLIDYLLEEKDNDWDSLFLLN
ncbi:lanthionine synthetase LanC family protein [Flavobacterium sp. HJJ]|uniref:lanthionine synthetase LanC family protein n=1 Tax=Flavobacterium sp. HJJ TaxID=2783792 RepID=UPI00188D9E6D|nr:lanthionine synthetase LanC family protein [Flavobacterium sp. HJJ]MBF4472436.1 hypothetical protein [Flavobacterium sp. HJJ]